jgi:hypothetical protein
MRPSFRSSLTGDRCCWPSALFDSPASLAFGTGAGEQQNLFVTNLGWSKKFIPQRTWPGPALVKVDAGAPGRPLHEAIVRD